MPEIGRVSKHAELTDVSTPHVAADLESGMATEAEVDSKISTHASDASAHHNQRSISVSDTNPALTIEQTSTGKLLSLKGSAGEVAYFEPDGDLNLNDGTTETPRLIFSASGFAPIEVYQRYGYLRFEEAGNDLMRLNNSPAAALDFYNAGIRHATGAMKIRGSGGIDLQETAGYGMRIPTSAPASPSAGSMYFDAATNTLYIHNGTAWVSVTLA